MDTDSTLHSVQLERDEAHWAFNTESAYNPQVSYTRLAATGTGSDREFVYLYHQKNGTHLAEIVLHGGSRHPQRGSETPATSGQPNLIKISLIGLFATNSRIVP
jgi:hypothetical protein